MSDTYRDKIAWKQGWGGYMTPHGWGRHPSSYAKTWRREARVKQNRLLRNCKDYEELQIETKLGKLTSCYDWY